MDGVRRAQVLRSFKRQCRASRKTHVAIPTIESVASLQISSGATIGGRPCDPPRTVAVGLFCAAVIGFFYLLRLGELEALKGGKRCIID